MAQDDDRGFWLHDLRVETVLDGRTPVCRHVEGEAFAVEGETLVFPEGGRVSMYALAALLPLLPAKQRPTDPDDWMATDAEVACPDPHCGGRFRITRTGRRFFRHSETTGLPDARATPWWQKEEGRE
ncbi:MAG: TIGR04076 family protein [Gemmobacter sp.]